MRLLIATDAWTPQINGVVRTLNATAQELRRRGVAVEVVSPDLFPNAAMPGYAEIRMAWPSQVMLRETFARFQPNHVHIATEGPIGWAMRHHCLHNHIGFTTSYHTRFPEYLKARLPVPLELSYLALRSFHNAGEGVMVATPSIEAELVARGFANPMRWSRGVDLAGFHRAAGDDLKIEWPRPIFLSVGRLAPEKNLEAFLSLDLPGTKVVVGDGPSADELRVRFPSAIFLGAKTHAELPAIYARADVFVFPSLTDTFGLVLIEALACGLPVAAFPAPGPVDVIGTSGVGIISTDLRAASLEALAIDRALCRSHAESFTWERATDQFLNNIATVRARRQPAQRAA